MNAILLNDTTDIPQMVSFYDKIDNLQFSEPYGNNL